MTAQHVLVSLAELCTGGAPRNAWTEPPAPEPTEYWRLRQARGVLCPHGRPDVPIVNAARELIAAFVRRGARDPGPLADDLALAVGIELARRWRESDEPAREAPVQKSAPPEPAHNTSPTVGVPQIGTPEHVPAVGTLLRRRRKARYMREYRALRAQRRAVEAA